MILSDVILRTAFQTVKDFFKKKQLIFYVPSHYRSSRFS